MSSAQGELSDALALAVHAARQNLEGEEQRLVAAEKQKNEASDPSPKKRKEDGDAQAPVNNDQ
jgi:hypothetical protein